MWVYQKTLQHPVNIKNMDLKMAKYLITQFGGPNGELAASLRYLSQRYTMPTGKTRALLTDIGTEELAHVEMIASMVYQLTADATPEQLKAAGLGTNYAQNGFGIYPSDANGVPFTTAYIAVMGDFSGDGKVTAQDLSTINAAALDMVHLEGTLKITGDIDENGNITATDLSEVNSMFLQSL